MVYSSVAGWHFPVCNFSALLSEFLSYALEDAKFTHLSCLLSVILTTAIVSDAVWDILFIEKRQQGRLSRPVFAQCSSFHVPADVMGYFKSICSCCPT